MVPEMPCLLGESGGRESEKGCHMVSPDDI